MPKTSVHKYHLSSTDENNVRGSGKITSVKAKPVSQGKQHFPDKTFRSSIHAADSRHVAAACQPRQTVCHDTTATCSPNSRDRCSKSLRLCSSMKTDNKTRGRDAATYTNEVISGESN